MGFVALHMQILYLCSSCKHTVSHTSNKLVFLAPGNPGSAVLIHLAIINSSIRLSAVGFNVLCINLFLNYTNHPPWNKK